jgi:hypothetical protein
MVLNASLSQLVTLHTEYQRDTALIQKPEALIEMRDNFVTTISFTKNKCILTEAFLKECSFYFTVLHENS